MFPAGSKDASDAVEYDGGRTSDAIVAWALDKLAENVPPPDTVEVCGPPLSVMNINIMYSSIADGQIRCVIKHPSICYPSVHFSGRLLPYVQLQLSPRTTFNRPNVHSLSCGLFCMFNEMTAAYPLGFSSMWPHVTNITTTLSAAYIQLW